MKYGVLQYFGVLSYDTHFELKVIRKKKSEKTEDLDGDVLPFYPLDVLAIQQCDEKIDVAKRFLSKIFLRTLYFIREMSLMILYGHPFPRQMCTFVKMPCWEHVNRHVCLAKYSAGQV